MESLALIVIAIGGVPGENKTIMTDEQAIQAAAQASNPNVNTGTQLLPPEVANWLKTVNPSWSATYEQIQSVANHPVSQFSITLVRDPQFRDAASEIAQKFQKNTVIGYELGWILMIWILRAWRLSKAGTWLTRIWVQAWVGMVFWVGTLFLIPWLLWGKSYQIVLATAFRAFVHQFWA